MADVLNPAPTANGGWIDTGLQWLGKSVDIYGDFERARRATDIEYQGYDATEPPAARSSSPNSGLLIAAGLALAVFLVYRMAK